MKLESSVRIPTEAICIHYIFKNDWNSAQLAGAVEYADCISSEW